MTISVLQEVMVAPGSGLVGVGRSIGRLVFAYGGRDVVPGPGKKVPFVLGAVGPKVGNGSRSVESGLVRALVVRLSAVVS